MYKNDLKKDKYKQLNEFQEKMDKKCKKTQKHLNKLRRIPTNPEMKLRKS
jgi:hypothetical protein